MKTKKTLIFIFSILLLVSKLSAQNTMSLTVDDAVKMAISNNKSLKRESLSLKKLERAKRFPYGDIFSSANLSSQLEVPFLNREENSIAIGATLEAGVSFSPAIFKKIERTKLEYEAGNITYEKAMRIIEANVKIIFYRIIYETEYAALSKEIYETLLDQCEQIEKKYKAGRLPESDFLNAKIECNKQRSSFVEAHDIVLESTDTLKQILGLGIDDDCKIELAGNFPKDINNFLLETENELLNVKQSSQNLDVLYLEKSLQVAEANVKELKMIAFAPMLGVGVQYNPRYAFQDTTMETKGFQQNGNFSIGISWNVLNLFPFSESQSQIKDAQDEVESLKLEIEKEIESQKIRTAGYVRQIERLIDAIKSDVLNKELAEQNYEIANAAYKNGYKDFSVLRDASDQKKNAELDLLRDVFSLMETKINLRASSQ